MIKIILSLQILLTLVFSNNNLILLDCDQDSHESCIDFKNNQITQQLNNIPFYKKIQQINSIISQYSDRKLKVIDTQFRGLGVYLEESIQSRQKLFSFDLKKVIGTNLINQSIFFQKSLFLNHKIIKIYLRKLIPSFKGNAQLAKLFLITINLLYHFGRIQDSFLKADLEALPLTYSIPWHKINVYEKNLFKHNLNKFKVEQIQQAAYEDFQNITIELQQQFSPELFNFFFQREQFYYSEFLYLQYVRSTRQHFRQSNRYLFPIVHYVNQATDIEQGQFITRNYKVKRKYVVFSTEEIQYQNQEFLYNYGYQSLESYVFGSGFVPVIKNLECISYKILDDDTSNKMNIQAMTCLDQQKLLQYSMILTDLIDMNILSNCYERSNHHFKNMLKNIDSLELQYIQILKECFHQNKYSKIQHFDIFRHIKDDIIFQKKIVYDHINELNDYLNIRKQNHKDQQIAQLLVDYQNKYYESIQEAENQLKQFLNQIEN